MITTLEQGVSNLPCAADGFWDNGDAGLGDDADTVSDSVAGDARSLSGATGLAGDVNRVTEPAVS